MKVIPDKYKKVADFCYKLFRIAQLPLHSSKFSNKIYSQFQHLFLLIYKQYKKYTYEELLTDLANNKELRHYLGFSRKIPHYTTLIKFAKRLPRKILDKLLLAFKEIIPKPKEVAMDATGITLDNASSHYCKRTGIPYKKRPFMKLMLIADIERYIILVAKQRKKTRHDTIDAKPLLKKLSKHYKPDVLYADRGFDDEKIFKIAFEEVGAYPLIFQKNQDVPKHRRKGYYRKKTFTVFDYGRYLQRNKIETLNSMFKRKFGSRVKSRLDLLQKFEIMTRIIAYNIDRLINIGIKIFIFVFRSKRVS